MWKKRTDRFGTSSKKLISEWANGIILVNLGLLVEKQLSFFLINKLISIEAAKSLKGEINQKIRELGANLMDLVKGFGVPEHMVHAPIFTGYQKYYQSEISDGEHFTRLRAKF